MLRSRRWDGSCCFGREKSRTFRARCPQLLTEYAFGKDDSHFARLRGHWANQAQPPLFRPIATDVKAEKRFLSTIARRLDTLGAITKGQRQTGGQGLFRADDHLESNHGRAALRQLYVLMPATALSPAC